MQTGYRNSAFNPLFELWDYGLGPWSVTGYTATRWKLLRTGTPTVTARKSAVSSSVSIDKWVRGVNALLVDTATLAAGQNVQVRQYQERGNRHGRGAFNMKVMLAGPTGGTCKVGINGVERTVTTVGIAGSVSATRAAQAGAASAITLNAAESGVDGALTGKYIEIVAGTGAGQIRAITGYTGASKVATVDAAWLTAPDATSTYKTASYWAPQYVEFTDCLDDPAQEYVTIDPLGTPSAGSWMIVAVQLEYLHNSASVSSPWELRSRQVERMLCSRYVHPVGLGNNLFASGTTAIAAGVHYPTMMRVAPSFRPYDATASVSVIAASNGGVFVAPTPVFSVLVGNEYGCRFKIDGFTGLTADKPYLLGNNVVGIFDADY